MPNTTQHCHWVVSVIVGSGAVRSELHGNYRASGTLCNNRLEPKWPQRSIKYACLPRTLCFQLNLLSSVANDDLAVCASDFDSPEKNWRPMLLFLWLHRFPQVMVQLIQVVLNNVPRHRENKSCICWRSCTSILGSRSRARYFSATSPSLQKIF